MYQLALQEEALISVKEAYRWYEEQREGLGDEILAELQNVMKCFPSIHNTTFLSITGTEYLR
jgi:hypothetical protein